MKGGWGGVVQVEKMDGGEDANCSRSFCLRKDMGTLHTYLVLLQLSPFTPPFVCTYATRVQHGS